MERMRKQGALRRAITKLKGSADRLLGRRQPIATREEQEVERELRETYDHPATATQARSGFRQ
jgi:hypothetical protein